MSILLKFKMGVINKLLKLKFNQYLVIQECFITFIPSNSI